MPLIGIINYGFGNLLSVQGAFGYLGHDMRVVEGPADMDAAITHLVLPGVGAFSQTMDSLKERGLTDVIRKFVTTDKPFLGICVGMQILFDKGYEFGEHDGMGLIRGRADHITALDQKNSLRVPHTGWTQISLPQESRYQGAGIDNEYMYFNHSYACAVEDKSCRTATLAGGSPWAVMVEKDNITGIQCHPEKSHVAGLHFLESFARQ